MIEKVKNFISSELIMIGAPVTGGGIGLVQISQIVSIISITIGLALGIISFYLKEKERKMTMKTEKMNQELLAKQLEQYESTE